MYIIYTYYILCMCVCVERSWGKSAAGLKVRSKVCSKNMKTKRQKNEIKPQHFRLEWVKNEAKRKQSESKQKQAHTTKRNVCVMYGKYVHCTHTHSRTRTHSCIYGYVLLRKGTHKYFI